MKHYTTYTASLALCASYPVFFVEESWENDVCDCGIDI